MRTIHTRARNIRSVANATFTPAPTGLTAIIGPNGSGKSTMTTIVPLIAAWGDAKQVAGSMGDILAEGAKSGTAEWSFEAEGRVYTVTRNITRTAKGASSKVSMTIDGSAALTKGLSATEIASQVTEVLGVGPDEFLVTSLIAQGETDALTSANPAVVRDQVRKTLGLDRVIRAADSLERDIKPKMKAVPDAPDTETIDSATYAVEAAEDALRDAESKLDPAAADAETRNTALRAAEAQLTAARRVVRDIEAGTGALSEANAAVERATTAEREAATAVEDIATKAGVRPEDAEEQWRELSGIAERVATLRASLHPVHGDAEKLAADERSARDAADAVQAELDGTNWDAEIESATSTAAAAAARAATDREAAETLSGHSDCPTCGTHLDDPSALVNRLTASAEEAESEASQARATSQELTRRKRSLTEELRSATAAMNSAAQAAAVAVSDAEHNAAVNEQIAETLGGWEEDALAERIDLLSNGVGGALSAHQRAVAATAAARERLESLDAVDPSGLPDAQADVERAEKVHAAALTAARTAGETLAAAQAEVRAAQETLNRESMELADLTERADARASALADISTQVHTVKTLRQFATAYTTERVSVIEDAVNALLPGAGTPFSKFYLGASFTPEVEYQGHRRSTKELSGGERAVVGLLFRIGVTAAVNGGTLTGTLTADEPLANLDAETRERVSNILASLPCPVTVISHSPEPVDAAVHTVEFSRDANGHTVVA